MLPNGLDRYFGSRSANGALRALQGLIVQSSPVPEPEAVLTIKPCVRLMSLE
jgi:hypothetical protein